LAKKLFIKTYGCQMNVYDSARMADVLAPLGYAKTETPDDADMVIINTCHIREKAAEKVFSELGHWRLRKEEARRQALTSNAKALFDDGVSYVAGNPKGDVTLVEFFDYRCGYCKQVQQSVMTLIKEDPRLRVVLKELPVLGPDSVLASRAAIAALEQDKGGKYLGFHNALMSFRGQLTEAEVFRIAASSGLDVTKLKADMAAPKVEQVIRANLALAEKLGINGTPGFVIGQELIPGAISLESMRKLVQAARG